MKTERSHRDIQDGLKTFLSYLGSKGIRSLLAGMRACRCRRLKGVCALMLCVTLALHMLIMLLVLSMFPSTCEPVRRPQTQPQNLTSANLTRSGSARTARPVGQRRVGAGDLAKLEALFSHALYTLQAPSSPDDDTLLRVRAQENEDHDAEQW